MYILFFAWVAGMGSMGACIDKGSRIWAEGLAFFARGLAEGVAVTGARYLW